MTVGERLAAHGLALPAGHAIVGMTERPDLRDEFGDFNVAVWPEFMLHDPVANTLWDHLFDDFAAFQLCLLGPDGAIAAGCNASPLAWDGTDDGLPEAGTTSSAARSTGSLAGSPPDTLGALQIVVRPDVQGSGYSSVMLGAMRANAAAHGFRALIACVRPSRKVEHPHVPIEEYVTWTRDDGLPADPWLRVHVRAGGRIVRTSPSSMTIEGTVGGVARMDWPRAGELRVLRPRRRRRPGRDRRGSRPRRLPRPERLGGPRHRVGAVDAGPGVRARCYDPSRSGGRVVEGGGLENRRAQAPGVRIPPAPPAVAYRLGVLRRFNANRAIWTPPRGQKARLGAMCAIWRDDRLGSSARSRRMEGFVLSHATAMGRGRARPPERRSARRGT